MHEKRYKIRHGYVKNELTSHSLALGIPYSLYGH